MIRRWWPQFDEPLTAREWVQEIYSRMTWRL